MVGLLANRALAWLILGGGGLAVIAMLYTGALHRGVKKEAAEWKAAVQERVFEQREQNHKINQGTLAEDADLRQKEEMIRDKWRNMGRGQLSSVPATDGKEASK